MSLAKSRKRDRRGKPTERRRASLRTTRHLRLESLEDRRVFSATPLDAEPLVCEYEEPAAAVVADDFTADLQNTSSSQADAPQPVLIVISNQDFWYQDYADTRAALESQGLEVVVAATTTDVARPHANSGQGGDDGFVEPDLALSDVNADDYSGIVFSGGWGMAQYQYGFEGTYHHSAYQGDAATRQVVNDLVNEFLNEDKPVAAICYGVSVLAYARVDGESPLAGRMVTGWNGAAPSADGSRQSSREQIESNGAEMLAAGSIGKPSTSTDDVYVDGNIITAENYDAARSFGEVVAREVIAAHEADGETDEAEPVDRKETQPKPVLMVIANRDFYWREYGDTREAVEAAGLQVVVAAATTEVAVPHLTSGVPQPNVTPDLALADVKAEDYSAIVFVGGYGAASYQYANETTYDNPAYRGSDEVKAIVNDLINDFVAQDKYLAAICNGVTVLAWARVDGVSPLEGRTVTAWAHNLPSADGGVVQTTREQIEANGARQLLSGSIGDPATTEDDVWVDGQIVTAQDYDSAYMFGLTLADQLLNG